MVHREPRVIESCSQPVCRHPRCVARCAGRREPGRRVVRIRRPVVVSRMAGIAIRRRSSKDAVDVAQIARHRRVCALQWERRIVVVKRRIQPCGSRMAHGAIGRISGRDVIGDTSTERCRAVVVGRVAAVTICGQRPRVVVRVARGARDGRVRAGQRKRRSAVVECRVEP